MRTTMTRTMTTTETATTTEQRRPPLPRRRRLTISVRARILAWVVILVALAMLVSGLATYTVLIARLDERTNDRIVQEIEEFRTLVETGIDPESNEPLVRSDPERLFTIALERNVPDSDETLFAVMPGRTPLRTSATSLAPLYDDAAFVAALSAMSEPTYGDIASSAGPVRFAALPVITGDQVGGVYVVAIFTDVGRGQITEAMTTFASVGAAALAAIAVAGWLVAGRLLAPVRLVRQTARQISETDLTQRIPAHGNDDISELARTFNAMLDRIEDGFAVQRQFLDDASHELRTPITIVRGHLELLSAEDDSAEHAETKALVLDELDRMSRLVDDLVTLAKVERPGFLRLGPVDLRSLAEDVHDKARAIAPRHWELVAGADQTIHADRQRLTQALIQLAENAAKHTADGDRIVIGSAAGDGAVRLWVDDCGPGVDPEDAQRIFERFTCGRGDQGRSDGSGLGLAIVRAIAEAHGGQVSVDSPPRLRPGLQCRRRLCPLPAAQARRGADSDCTRHGLPPGLTGYGVAAHAATPHPAISWLSVAVRTGRAVCARRAVRAVRTAGAVRRWSRRLRLGLRRRRRAVGGRR